MKQVSKKTNQISFVAEVEESLANAIRRYLNEIPILAIDEVDILKNDSALYDETISHRLGLVPLKMEKSFKESSKIDLKLVGKKEGPVYSGELKGGVEIVYGKIPITILNKDQELEILASAKLGKGSEHAKFSPGLMFYRNVAEIKIDKDCNECEKCVEACGKGILKISNKKLIVDNVYDCDLCEACVDACRKHGKDSITITPSKELIVTIESFGQLPIKDMINGSVKELQKDLSEISKKLGK